MPAPTTNPTTASSASWSTDVAVRRTLVAGGTTFELESGVTVLSGLDDRHRGEVADAVRTLLPEGAGFDPVVGRFALSPVGVDARFDALRVELAVGTGGDPTGLRAALQQVRTAPMIGALVPSPEALQLAEQLRRAEHVLARPAAAVPDEELAEAEARVSAAEAEVAEQESLAGPRVRQADLDELERAHTAVLDAQDRLGGRFGAARAQQRYDAAVAHERAVLDRLQIRSYTEFMTGGMRTGRSLIGSDELVEARRELAAAERALDVVRRRVADAEAHAEVVADHQRLCALGRELLGADVADRDLRSRLLAHRIPAEAADPTEVLVDALSSVGLGVAADRPLEDLIAIAGDWLRSDEDGRRARVAVELELEQMARLHPPEPVDAERHLVACIARSRSVRSSDDGPVPLVVDRALDVFGDPDVDVLLERLSELAGDVPVVVISDDPRIMARGRSPVGR